MLLIAIVPVTLVATLVVGVFWFGRVSDQDRAYQQRNEYLVQQMALASEYGVFSGNLVNLRAVLLSMLRQPDVYAAGIFDGTGNLLVGSNDSFTTRLELLNSQQYRADKLERGIDVLIKPIEPIQVLVDDVYSGGQGDKQSTALGFVMLEVSQEARELQRRETTLVAVAVWLAGVLLGGFLAVRLGMAIANPLLRVSNVIQRIGRGDFSLASDFKPADPLATLQHELNRMAARLSWGRVELERQVELATADLKVKKEEAEAATRAKTMFLAAASHDLRQPTHALGMFTARLKQLTLNPEADELANYLQASVNSMQDLLDGLLDISRLESGTVNVATRETPLAPILNAIRTALEPLAAHKNIQLRVKSSEMWCVTDPVLLQRILMNLTHNALRYTDEGLVLVTCRPVNQGAGVRIDVSDSGVGIDASDHQAIFSEFYQASNPARDRGKGMGLGLSIVEKTAKLLGHKVTMRSHLGCGSRFSVALDRCPPADNEVVVLEPIRTALIKELDGVKVLLAEDDPLVRKAVALLLQSWGCTVVDVEDYEKAVDRVRGGIVPDFILSDFRMGGSRDGAQLIKEIRSLVGQSVPACLVSGDTDIALMQRAAAEGLTLLHKPVRPAKLRSLLRRLLKPQSP